MQVKTMVTTDDEYETVLKLSSGAICNDLE